MRSPRMRRMGLQVLMSRRAVRCLVSWSDLVEKDVPNALHEVNIPESANFSSSRLFVGTFNYEVRSPGGRTMGCNILRCRSGILGSGVSSTRKLRVSLVVNALELVLAIWSVGLNYVRHGELLPTVYVLPVTTSNAVQNHRDNCLMLQDC